MDDETILSVHIVTTLQPISTHLICPLFLFNERFTCLLYLPTVNRKETTTAGSQATMATHRGLHADTTGLEAATLFPSSIRDKTILVTGVARTGIGGTTAVALASQAPRFLILSGRDATKVQGVIDDIKEKYPNVKTRFLRMDLSNQASVRKAAAELMNWADVEGLDVLINNAGVMGLPERVLSVDGIEMQFATNHIGHFLFTNLIRNKLVAAAKNSSQPGAVRVINVSSLGHVFGPIRFSDINFDKPKEAIPESEWPDYTTLDGFDMGWKDDGSTYHHFASYGQSKTANILFSLQLQRLLGQKYGIISFGLHPGGIETELSRHSDPEWLKNVRERIRGDKTMPQLKSLEAGSSTTIVAACDPGLKGTKENVYLSDCQVVETLNEWARDEAAAERLWELSEKLVGEKFAW